MFNSYDTHILLVAMYIQLRLYFLFNIMIKLINNSYLELKLYNVSLFYRCSYMLINTSVTIIPKFEVNKSLLYNKWCSLLLLPI